MKSNKNIISTRLNQEIIQSIDLINHDIHKAIVYRVCYSL